MKPVNKEIEDASAEVFIEHMLQLQKRTNSIAFDTEVVVDGKSVTYLNSNLITKQKLNIDDVERIKALHRAKYRVHKLAHMVDVSFNEILKQLAKLETDIEFELQRAWKFPLNRDYHRFWNFPRCQCPFTDNEDAYPTGYYVTNSSCPVHGNDEGN